MAEALTAKDQSSADNASDRTSDRGFDRLASFRIIYIAIFSFVAFSVVTVLAVESLLSRHFKEATNAAIRVSPANGPIAPQIQSQVSDITRGSAWTPRSRCFARLSACCPRAWKPSSRSRSIRCS